MLYKKYLLGIFILRNFLSISGCEDLGESTLLQEAVNKAGFWKSVMD
jgi:hypothetical protein